MKKEIWKGIKNYKGYYQISNSGIAMSIGRVIIRNNGRMQTIKERILKPTIHRDGYLLIYLSKNSKVKTYKVHHLVLESFGSKKPSKKHQCNHKDGNKQNNNLSNLEWVTCKQNIHHAYQTNLYKRKMVTNKKMEEIRETHKQKNVTHEFLAKKYRVCQRVIFSIIHNEMPVRSF